MSPEAGALDRLAASVADGTGVDWGLVEADVAPRERRLVRHLRLVESIASLYRSIPDVDETIGHGEPDGPRWGRLVMLERIGQGTSCDVYKAFDTDLYSHVALKLLHADGNVRRSHERILQEARRLARVRHPHVVQVLGAEQHVDRVGLWMELVEGESLDRIVAERGPFGDREAAAIGRDVCSALAAVHAAGLLHRDVKAQNVMRERGGRIVLMDFGTGEELRPEGSAPRMVGTPLYLAPEIVDGQSAAVQSDLYAVGVLLFYLVTAKFPVEAATFDQLTAAHRERTYRRLRDVRPDLPAAFVAVVDRALARSPADRYQSAGDLEAALREASAPAVSLSPVSAVRPAPYRWQAVAAGSIAALLVLVAGLLGWMRATRVAAPAGARPTLLAVMPFRDLSPTPSGYLANGLTDQLVATLGQVQSLRLTAPSSVARFIGQPTPPEQVAKLLGVDALVDGTVKVLPARGNAGEPAGGGNADVQGHAGTPGNPGVAGDDPLRAIVGVRIVQAGVPTPIYTNSFEWTAGDGLTFQTTLANAITTAVNATIRPGEARRMAAARQTDPMAEQAFMQGREQLSKYGPDGARRALQMFDRAIALDPQYAGAYAARSRAYVVLGQFGAISPGEARQSAAAAARKALEIDADLADAYVAIADLKFYFDWDWDEAERHYRIGLDKNPSLPTARRTYAELLALRRHFPEAITHARLAVGLDPASGDANLTNAVVLLYARRNQEAEAIVLDALRDHPDSAGAHVVYGRLAESRGDLQGAIQSVSRAAELSSGGGVPVQVMMLQLLAHAGRQDEARAGLADLEAQSAAGKIRLSYRDRAFVKLWLGDVDGACDEYQRAFDDREPGLMWMAVDPRVDALRQDPRFQSILKRMQLN